MNRQRKTLSLLGSAGVAVTLVACGSSSADESTTSSESETVRISSMVGGDTSYGRAIEAWANQTQECTDGELQFEHFSDGSLYAAPETRDAIAAGRVEVGAFSATYHAGDFPLTEGLFNVPFLSSNVAAVMEAQREIYDSTPEAQAEWSDQNLHLLAALASPPVPMSTTVPFNSLRDLEGLDLRGIPSGGLNAAIQAAGGNAVDLELADVPEGLERGVIQGLNSVTMELVVQQSLYENVGYLTDAGFGSVSSISLAVNSDWWERLSDEAQDCASEAARDMSKPYIESIKEAETEACATLQESGVELATLPESEVEKWTNLIRDDEVESWMENAEGVIEDPDAYLRRYQEVLQTAEEKHAGETFGVVKCLQE